MNTVLLSPRWNISRAGTARRSTSHFAAWSRMLLLTAALVTIAGCQKKAEEAAAPPSTAGKAEGEGVSFPVNSPQLAALVVEAAQPSETSTVRLNARLVWDDDITVRVFTPFAGRVAKISTEIGQPVEKDDMLAAIASPDFGQAQADLHKAATALALAQRNITRLKELFENGAVPQKDFHAAQSDLEQAKSEHERTSARLKFYGGSVSAIDQTFQLRAPISGIAVEKNINPGQEVRPDQMLANVQQIFAPLFVITDPKHLWILIDATEQDLPQLKTGTALTVRSRVYPQQTFPGKIDFVSDSLDPSTRTVKVRGSVDNAQRLLKAEMFVNVELNGDKPTNGVSVPTKAVFLKGEKHFLFVEDTKSKGSFVRREIKVGRENDGKISVLEGVEANQGVVVEGALLLEAMLASVTKS